MLRHVFRQLGGNSYKSLLLQQNLHQRRAFRATSPLLRRQANHYQLLGVSPTASDKEIKAQYFRMAKKYHPDTNPDDQTAKDKFNVIHEAYEVLSDPEKREQYDHQQGLAGAGAS